MADNKKQSEQVSRHALEVFEERNRAFRVLYDTIIELEKNKDISAYEILAQNLRRICRAEFVILGRFQPATQTFFLETISFKKGAEDWVREAPVSQFPLPPEIVSVLKKNEIFDCPDPTACLCSQFFEHILKDNHPLDGLSFSRFSCHSDNQMMALGLIALPKGQKVKPKDVIEIYLNFAGMVIHRFLNVESIKQSEKNLKRILDSIPTGIMMIDGQEKKIINVNSAAQDLMGSSDKGLLGKSCMGLFCLNDQASCPIADNNQLMDFSERELRKGDGAIIPILKSVVPMTLDGRVVYIESFIDISEQKRNEAMIAEEKERLAVTLRSIGDGVITVNREKRILFINKIAEQLLGFCQEEVAGKDFGEIFHLIDPKNKQPIEGLLDSVVEKGDSIELTEGLLLARDGTQRLINDSVAPIRDIESRIIGAVLVFRDISERRKMEEELIKKQKLESLGLLAGGIAHDFNNILAVIVTQVAVAKMKEDLDEYICQVLNDIESEALRAKNLTQQLMTFSKGGAPIKKLSSLKDIIIDSSNFVLHGSSVLCEFSIPDGLWVVEVDKGQINQVIQNIVLNAQQAMPNGGTITISAENLALKERMKTLPLGLYVRIKVSDTGEGIEPEIMEKIFDPYFTTKPNGSGLGLATVFSVVKRHEGLVTVDSPPGGGAVFTIYLPACGEMELKEPVRRSSSLSGHEKVLLMDDEPSLRESMTNLLRNYGYEVHSVSHGEDAIQIFQKEKLSSRQFDLVILDLTIKGGLGGKETVQRLRAVCPDVKIIAASGYSQDPVLSNYEEFGFDGIIVKPFTIEELTHVMKSV